MGSTETCRQSERAAKLAFIVANLVAVLAAQLDQFQGRGTFPFTVAVFRQIKPKARCFWTRYHVRSAELQFQ
jgi:hypothetical protein